jgi:biopolymer transport protein ExbD
MGEIIQEEKQEKGTRRKPKKHSTHLDMTPMVDLMCLLITFFMLTTAFSKPKVMEITMPEKSDTQKKEDQTKIQADRTYNILLSGDDKIYWYTGLADPKKPPLPTLISTNYGKDGIRKVLLQKNKNVFKQIEDLKTKVLKGELVMADSVLNRKIKEIKKTDKKSPIILIKADEKAKYKNIVDIIDEMAICNIASYAVVDISDVELEMLKTAPK